MGAGHRRAGAARPPAGAVLGQRECRSRTRAHAPAALGGLDKPGRRCDDPRGKKTADHEEGHTMSDRIILRAGEALVAGGPPNTASEPEVIIGELDGPVGTALATLTGDQVVGHSRVFALLNTDIMVRPVTLCVSKVSVTENKYTSILMGTVQYAIANGVLDAVRAGYIPKEKANDLGIICSVWLSPGVIQAENVDHKALFEIQRKGMTEAIRKAMTNEPSIDWLLENQDKIVHKYYQMGLDGKI
jgi:formaldehyde-activating enzyme